MANEEQLERLKQGVEGWNKWREENPATEINLENAELRGAYLTQIYLRGADLREANLSIATLDGARLVEAYIEGAYPIDTDLREASLKGSLLGGAVLRRANLRGADLSEAHLLGAHLDGAHLSGAHLEGAHLSIAHLDRAYLDGAHLDRAHLVGARLIEAHIEGAYLNDTDLREANLKEASLEGAVLRRANLRGADLSLTNLRGANLWRADLRFTNLKGANLRETMLKGANLDKAILANTHLEELNLSATKGLEEAYHFYPSPISTSTLKRSKGKIPVNFLRGCGLNDWEIESAKLYQPGLSEKEVNDIVHRIYDMRANQAVQIKQLFISYSHKDNLFVDEIEKHLDKRGIRFWRDIHDATAGRLEKVVDRAIRRNPIMLLILSERSVKSDWVEHEARTARELEKELGRDVLCPVALDESWKTCPWDAVLRDQIMKYHILDFSKWKDEREFDKMFTKLIDGLDLFY
jgi:uncharacterized protein YjbI with pentapeptide repeats